MLATFSVGSAATLPEAVMPPHGGSTSTQTKLATRTSTDVTRDVTDLPEPTASLLIGLGLIILSIGGKRFGSRRKQDAAGGKAEG